MERKRNQSERENNKKAFSLPLRFLFLFACFLLLSTRTTVTGDDDRVAFDQVKEMR